MKKRSKAFVKAKTKEALDRITEAEANKTLVLQNPEKLGDDNLRVLHAGVAKKFSKIGWKVSDGEV